MASSPVEGPDVSDGAFVCPHCGECTMEQFFLEEGCLKQVPNSEKKKILFPYLDVPGLDEADRIDLEYRLKSETRKMKLNFSKFTLNLRRSLEDLKIPLEKLKESILSLEAFTDDIGVKALDEEDRQEIKTAKTLSDVFIALHKYISFFNYHIIEHIIDQHGAMSDHHQLEEYVEKFKDFCRRSIFEVPQDVFASKSRKKAQELALKCTEGVSTMQGVVEAVGDVAEVFGLRPSALQLCSIKKGCVELHFCISAAIADRIFPVSPSQHSALSEMGIRVISLDKVDYAKIRAIDKTDGSSTVTVEIKSLEEGRYTLRKPKYRSVLQVASSTAEGSLKTEDTIEAQIKQALEKVANQKCPHGFYISRAEWKQFIDFIEIERIEGSGLCYQSLQSPFQKATHHVLAMEESSSSKPVFNTTDFRIEGTSYLEFWREQNQHREHSHEFHLVVRGDFPITVHSEKSFKTGECTELLKQAARTIAGCLRALVVGQVADTGAADNEAASSSKLSSVIFANEVFEELPSFAYNQRSRLARCTIRQNTVCPTTFPTRSV